MAAGDATAAAGVTGLLLAGGRATRMDGRDKGLIGIAGRPLAAHVLAALRPQVEAVLINANRNAGDYEALGARVIADSLDGYLGPLAGVLAGLEAASTGLVATLPCDSPFVAPDLVERLRAGLAEHDGDIAVAHDGERRQPVFMLLRADLAGDLRAWLEAGGRKIDAWYAGHRVVDVDFRDRIDTFININTPEERDTAEARLTAAGTGA